jgi:drug/metabolite transporter (DMT)-like permease
VGYEQEILPVTEVASSVIPAAEVDLSRERRLGLNALLIVVTIIWGTTFLVTHTVLHSLGPFSLLALRFALATVILGMLYYRNLRRITRAEIVFGLAIGLSLFASYALQTVGLQFTTSSKAGFITGFYVPLVPLFAVGLLRQRLTVEAVVGVVLSCLGLVLISITTGFDFAFGWGEILVLGCSVAAALQIILISKFVAQVDATNLTIIQIALTALLSGVAIPLVHEPLVVPTLPVWGAIVYLGIIATAFCLLVMNRVQRFVSSTQATLTYALEPMWAGLFGALAGEPLSVANWLGCGCLLLGMIVSRVDLISLLRKQA